MIRFEAKTLGSVILRFHHTLPSVELAPRNNDLIAMVKNIKINKGSTHCSLEIIGSDGIPEEYFGCAYTHPSDQYKKETGRFLSLKRAIEAANLSEAAEREILAGYYSR